MRRWPNPWILVPSVIAAVIGGLVGRRVAYVSCSVDPDQVAAGTEGCAGLEVAFAVIGAAVAFVGVAVVMVLAVRSLAEWREAQARGIEDQLGAGCETDQPEGRDAG